MKKILVVLVALFAMVAFISGVVAQDKKADKPAAAAAKPKAQKVLKVTGTVASYEAGKTITVKAKDKELAFDIAADAKVKGEVKEGAKVTVRYKKDGDKTVATAISVAAAKKPKVAKKEK